MERNLNEWLGEEPLFEADSISCEKTVELLICGGGMSGLAAFARAAELGCEVLLIEKANHLGAIRDEIAAVGSSLQKAEKVEIDVAELVRQCSMYSQGYPDQRLHRVWAEESGRVVDWYIDIVEAYGGKTTFQGGYSMEVKPGSYTMFPTGHRTSFPKGMSASQALADYARTRGGEVLLGVRLVKLLKEEGEVVGAIARNESSGELILIRATKGVIVATGGYARNQEMMSALQPQSLQISALNVSPKSVEGDGIKACLWAGAAMDDVHTSTIFDRCVLMPEDTPETAGSTGRPNEIVAQPFLRVDLKGRRFMNESAPYDQAVHRALSLPGKCYCVVFDDNFRTDTAAFEMAACSRLHPFHNGSPVAHPIEEIAQSIEGMVEQGRFVKADTLEELAAGLGIPKEAFLATVKRYNKLCDDGYDADFGKEPWRLSPVIRPPFYGARACGFILCTLDGVRINEYSIALDHDSNPIEGLYVVGCDSGSYYAGTYMNLITGCCGGRNMVFALRAVEHALGLAAS